MNRRIKALAVLGVAAVAAAGCGGGNGGGGTTDKTLVVGVDLPFQGASKDASDDTWQAMLGTAVRASYLCAQVAYPHLEANQGSLILITSAAGVEGSPYLPAYGVAKAAQRGLAKSLAREWGPAGVRVNSIGPVAMTPAMETVAETSPVFTDGLLVGRTPLRRIGDPEPDIGPVAVFLASDLARYMTGQTLMVDGGGFMAF